MGRESESLAQFKLGLLNRLGWTAQTPLAHRTFIAVCLSFGLIGLITLISNSLLHLALGLNLTIAVCLLGIAGLYWDWRRHPAREPRAMALMVLGLLTLALTWFPNGGLRSSGPLFFIPLTILAAVMLPRAQLLRISLLGAIEFGGLCWLETLYPHWVQPYTSPNQALFDMISAVGIICLSMGWCVHALVQAYHQERQRAEAASEAKSVFLAQMSHELRTPLNGVIGFSGLLLEKGEELNPERHRLYLKRIRANAEHLLALVNQILDLSRSEAGKLELHFETIDTRELVAEMTGLMEVLAREKGLRLRLELPEQCPPLRTDPVRLRQILLNLLGNAVKFTPSGSVVCRLQTLPRALRIEVEDTGPGISPELRQAVFEPFYRIDGRDQTQGAGLGLPITRFLCEKLGLGLELQATDTGKGCLFVLTLPLDGASESTDVPVPALIRPV